MSRRLLLFAAFVGISLLTRALSLVVEILDVDEAAHIVGSWELMRGEVLYTDFVDNKPPLLYIYYALAQLLLGRGLLAVHVLTALVTVPLTAWAASAFYGHDRKGVMAGLLYLSYSAAFLAHDMLSSNAEILMMLPASWAVVLIRSEAAVGHLGRVAGAGLLTGLAFLFKYQAAFWFPGIAVAVALVPGALLRTAARLATLFMAFALPLLLTYVLFRLWGGGEGLLYWTVLNNVVYAANPIVPSEALGRAASYFLPFLLVTAPLWWAWRRSLPLYGSRYLRLLIGSLIALSFVPAFLGFRFYPHYFIQFYWPLAVAASPYLAGLLRPPRPLLGKLVLAYSLFVLLGFGIANAFLYLGGGRIYRETDPVFRRVADALRADACYRGGSVFVWGYAPIFYYYADLPAASRFVVMAQSRLTSYISGNLESVRGQVPGGQAVPAHWDWLMSDLERNRATYILDTAPAGIFRWNRYPLRDFPRLLRYVEEKYEPMGEVSGVRIFRRRGCGAGVIPAS